MANCTSNNLDPVPFQDPRITSGQNCSPDPDYPTCSDLINICLCNPEIFPPPGSNSAKCVNDIIQRPWPPPPPANPGCNPFSVSVTSRQDTSVPVTENIRLAGEVKYIGNDPCLPELNLELLVNPDFRAGGGAPSARGWGISEYGHVGPWNTAAICPDSCCGYSNPQQYLAEAAGAESFIPDNDVDCNSQFDECEYKYKWAKKVARWNLIGPVLCEVTDFSPSETLTIQYIGDDGQLIPPRDITVAWSYTLKLMSTIRSGNTSIPGNSACQGIPAIPNLESSSDNVITGAISETFQAYNVKENTDAEGPGPFSQLKMTPGLDIISLEKTGFSVQPIMKKTLVLAYGWVPWNSLPAGATPQEIASKCNCEIKWFFDTPNAVAGSCSTTDLNTASSMLPSRTITSAGPFYGIASNENRV
jgi:hypothetical protein